VGRARLGRVVRCATARGGSLQPDGGTARSAGGGWHPSVRGTGRPEGVHADYLCARHDQVRVSPFSLFIPDVTESDTRSSHMAHMYDKVIEELQ